MNQHYHVTPARVGMVVSFCESRQKVGQHGTCMLTPSFVGTSVLGHDVILEKSFHIRLRSLFLWELYRRPRERKTHEHWRNKEHTRDWRMKIEIFNTSSILFSFYFWLCLVAWLLRILIYFEKNMSN